MRLISAVLGFLLRKMGLLVALVVSLILVSESIDLFKTTVADRERLPQVVEEVAALETDLEQLRSKVKEERRRVSEARVTREDKCGFRGKVGDLLVPGTPCKDAEEALEKAEEALRSFERQFGPAGEDGVEEEIAKKESELAEKKREEDDLNRAQESWVNSLIDRSLESWRPFATIAVLVLGLPIALRIVGYFLLMPIVRRAHKPIHLAAGFEDATADLRTTAAERTLTVRLAAGEVLSARSEYVRPVQGKVRSRLLYQWTSPFISFAAGLHGLSRITGVEGGTSATLGTPDDPDSYLMRIDFKNHPGVVMHPTHIVGVIGTPDLTTRWRWGLQSFATWQVRYIMFAGTGSLIVQGSGNVVAESPGGNSTRMDQNLVMGFDSRLTVGVNRTAVAVPYLRRKAPLVDDEFTGSHPFFWQKSSADVPSNPIAKTFGALFSGIGKLFGF